MQWHPAPLPWPAPSQASLQYSAQSLSHVPCEPGTTICSTAATTPRPLATAGSNIALFGTHRPSARHTRSHERFCKVPTQAVAAGGKGSREQSVAHSHRSLPRACKCVLGAQPSQAPYKCHDPAVGAPLRPSPPFSNAQSLFDKFKYGAKVMRHIPCASAMKELSLPTAAWTCRAQPFPGLPLHCQSTNT